MASKQTPSKYLYLDKSYLNNLPSTPSMSTPLGKYIAQKSTTDKSANANHTRMEHILLSAITIVYEELAISIIRLEKTLIHTNQVRASIDRWGHVDQEFSFRSRKYVKKILLISGGTRITTFL